MLLLCVDTTSRRGYVTRRMQTCQTCQTCQGRSALVWFHDSLQLYSWQLRNITITQEQHNYTTYSINICVVRSLIITRFSNKYFTQLPVMHASTCPHPSKGLSLAAGSDSGNFNIRVCSYFALVPPSAERQQDAWLCYIYFQLWLDIYLPDCI